MYPTLYLNFWVNKVKWDEVCAAKYWWIYNAWASAHRGKWGQLTPWKNGWKIKKRKHAKKSSFLCLCYILRAIRTGRCRERHYADHMFIQMYFRMHHFVVKFSKVSSPQAARGHWPPNRNPADVPATTITLLETCCSVTVSWNRWTCAGEVTALRMLIGRARRGTHRAVLKE